MLILVMFGLPFFTAKDYSIISHTTSQLGAQKTQNSWVMNAMFALMGISSIYAGWSHYSKYWLHKILLTCFGISLVCTAIYNHAPINPKLTFNIHEDELHSFFASATGFSFTILAISTGFIKNEKFARFLPILVGIIAALLSLIMFNIEKFMGVWQRLIFIISFGWMIYEFRNNLDVKKKQKKEHQ